MLVDVILAKSLNTTSREKIARTGSYRFILAWKLYCLIKPIYLGVSALAKKLRDVSVKARGQRAAARAKSYRSEGQRSPKLKT